MYNFHEQTGQSSGSFVLDEYLEISGHAIRYLKEFQLSAVRFLYNRLKKREFSILNDESGLGKTASSAVLLGTLATQQNCLIVVENNDDRVLDWRFHLDVLTDLNVRVLNEEKDYSEASDRVYIVKWSTLRLFEDLSKWRFDMIVVDNRDQLLTNSFCMSILLRNFEHKVQLVISGVDITSDVKLMFNILRLGGRLERQLDTFKAFDNKFHLPDQNAISNKKSDLEEYFRKREMMRDYCREFRLRRYCYQYENLLPLVDPQRYSAHLAHWKAAKGGGNNPTAIIISESISTVLSTEEFLQRNNTEENHSKRLDKEVQLKTITNSSTAAGENDLQLKANTPNDANDEDANMSPLIYNSESDSEEDVLVVELVDDDDDDDVQIIEETPSNKSKTQDKEERNEIGESQRIENSVQSNVEEPKNISKRDAQTAKDNSSAQVIGDGTGMGGISQRELHKKDECNNERLFDFGITTTEELSLRPEKKTNTPKERPKPNKRAMKEKIQESNSSTEASIDSDQDSKTAQCNSVEKVMKDNKNEKEENNKSTRERRNAKSVRKDSVKNLLGTYHRETRSMKRKTRSCGGTGLAVNFDQDKKPKTKTSSKKKASTKTGTRAKTAESESTEMIKPEAKNKSVEFPKPITPTHKSASDPPISQTLLPPSSDSDEIQCGQRLTFESSGENSSQSIKEKSNVFVFPSTPPSLRILPFATLPESDTDVIFLSDSNPMTKESVNLLSESTEKQKTVRPQRKRQNKRVNRKNPEKCGNISVKDQRIHSVKSPDLFSFSGSQNGNNNIPFTQVHCAIPQPTTSNTTFGFKIFGSEVGRAQDTVKPSHKTFQKQTHTYMGPSCLHMLDRMCETSRANGNKYALRKQKLTNFAENQSSNESSIALVPSREPINKPNQETDTPTPTYTQPIMLPSEDIFEITNNATFGSTLRINATGDISPVPQQQQNHNKITKYLIGSSNAKQSSNFTIAADDDIQSFGTPSNRVAIMQQSGNASVPFLRKSPKSLKSTQTTKLTKWFRRSFLDDSTQQQQHTETESAEVSNFSKNTRRRRLDLLFSS